MDEWSTANLTQEPHSKHTDAVTTDSLADAPVSTASETNVSEAVPPFIDYKWPRRVLFIWCAKKDFAFVNYLSLQSAIRSIGPSAVMLAYAYYNDKEHAFYQRTWIKDIQNSFPFLLRVQISESDNLCLNSKATKSTEDIRRFLEKKDFLGSLYVASRTIIVEPFVLKDADSILDFYDRKTGQGLLYVPERNTTSVNHGKCPKATDVDNQLPEVCFMLDAYLVKEKKYLEPESIMFNPSPLASQLRLIVYGSRRYPEHKPDSRNPAPNIAHYIWLGGGEMEYTFFMSILSAFYLGKVDKIYLHGDKPLGGELWEKLQSMDIASHIQPIPWHRPHSIFGREVVSVENQADLVKSNIMWMHGGILMDPDAMFVRRPNPEFFHYDAFIMGGRNPHMLNPAIAIAKPRSEYARLWLESEKEFVIGKYVWDCCFKMYKIWVRQPHVAKVDRHFNLNCVKGVCHPKWAQTFPVNDSVALRNLTGWKNRTVTVHFPLPNPYNSFEECAFKLGGIVGEVGRMILRAAGLLGGNEGLVP